MKHLLHTGLLAGAVLLASGLRPPPPGYEKETGGTTVTIDTVASGLEVPWEITWGPDNRLWFTEHPGQISRLDPATGKRRVLVKIPDVLRLTTPGLMGLVHHPDFPKVPYVYTCYTYRKDTAAIAVKLVRYRFENDRLVQPRVIFEVPGNRGHTGSRLTVSPDRKLMFATGDAAISTNAQDLHSPCGKILRLNLDGSIPSDNPIKGSPVWSYGHRNVQGLAYSTRGLLYCSDHGDATDDELNLIEPMRNYGWPLVEGYCDKPEEAKLCKGLPVSAPLTSWTPTVAPTGIAYYDSDAIPEWKHAILMTTLKGNHIRVLKLDEAGRKVVADSVLLEGRYGRLRDVCVSPDGAVYFSTSNRDWKPGPGYPKPGDDYILRIRRTTTGGGALLSALGTAHGPAGTSGIAAGRRLYTQYCASCHQENGKGIQNVFPALTANPRLDPTEDLVRILLTGINEKNRRAESTYDQQMPAFGFLSDSDLAALATHIRSAFGRGGAVTESQVKQVRAAAP